jgi:hypothetical protein
MNPSYPSQSSNGDWDYELPDQIESVAAPSSTLEDYSIETRISHRILLYAARCKPQAMNQFTIEDIIKEEIEKPDEAARITNRNRTSMHHNIKVNVVGPMKSGKSQVVRIIEEATAGMGIVVTEQNDSSAAMSRENPAGGGSAPSLCSASVVSNKQIKTIRQ